MSSVDDILDDMDRKREMENFFAPRIRPPEPRMATIKRQNPTTGVFEAHGALHALEGDEN